MKKALTLILIIFSITIIITGCGKKEGTKNNDNTLAVNLVQEFKKEITETKDIKKVAKKLAKSNFDMPDLEVSNVSKADYLTGFNEKIQGYKKAYVIVPTISTIPFIAYIFESDKPNELANTLKEQANLRWNICTEADEMQVAVVDNYVFFVMSPNNFDD